MCYILLMQMKIRIYLWNKKELFHSFICDTCMKKLLGMNFWNILWIFLINAFISKKSYILIRFSETFENLISHSPFIVLSSNILQFLTFKESNQSCRIYPCAPTPIGRNFWQFSSIWENFFCKCFLSQEEFFNFPTESWLIYIQLYR